MGYRQREKSEMTHQEIRDAALRLFYEKGYRQTSIQDIVTASGYSTGSFYNHYKTKLDVLVEIWNEHAISYIKNSIEDLKTFHTPEELAEYLITNSLNFDSDEKTMQLSRVAQEEGVFTGANYEAVREVSIAYIRQIAELLAVFCPHTERERLLSRASMLDAVQYSHSPVTRTRVGYIYDDDDIKHSLLLLIRSWIEEDGAGV